MSSPVIIAHRGASGTCPENTLRAFGAALDAGARWLELDTQLVEGELVVFHDETLERTTDGRGLLAEISLAGLRRLDAGDGERVPLLEEVLRLAAGRARVNIELKGVGTAAPLATLLTRLFNIKLLDPQDILASSLRIDELREFRRLLPQAPWAPIRETLPQDLDELFDGGDPWSLNLHKSLISDAVVAAARRHRSRVLAWTVNDVAQAERLFRRGVAGIFTDYPERFIIRDN